MMRLLSWKDGTKDCRKSSILPSLSVSMVLASLTDRVDCFSHQRHKEGHCSQPPNWEPLGRSRSGAPPQTPNPSESCTGQGTRVPTQKKVRGFKVPLVLEKTW